MSITSKNWFVVRYLLEGPIKIARSLVIEPPSTQSIQTCSIVFASSEDKVGLAVGITEKLVNKYDAVKFAKLGSEIIGGKGGGGRKDFAQAGGQNKNKIDEAFKKLRDLI